MSHDNNDLFTCFEDLDNDVVQSFARDAHIETMLVFADDDFYALKGEITAALRNEKQIPFCQEHRAKMYHFFQSADYPKGVYRVCSTASYRSGMPEWQILFNVADFDALLKDNVYLEGVSHYVMQPERVLLTLSASGADAAYTLEFDLASGAIVEGGFHFPAGKNHIAWRDENSVWVCPAWDKRQLTESGYPREVWLMRRGESFEDAQPVYCMAEHGVMVNAWRYLDGQGAPVDLIEAATGFFTKDYFQVTANGTPLQLNLPKDAEITGYLAGQLMVHLKTSWQRANQNYPAGSLLAVKLNKGHIGAAHLLFAPDETQALESVETTKRFVVASILDNVVGRLKAWKWEHNRWVEYVLPKLPEGTLELIDQPWGGDTVYLAANDFLHPLTLFALDLNVMELVILRRQPTSFNSTDIMVEQRYAISADGTHIPYYRVGKKAHSPNTPTLVYAYGGFNVPELPHYMGSIGRHWLERGHAFVLANIRGGGEFVHWHRAAQREKKHKSTDDLLAVVSDLHARGETLPQHTAIQGGSNGGLITASAFVRKPECIGALVCEVPLTDMLNYARLSAGASWIEEYGDPNDPLMHDYLTQFSPYHCLNDNQSYPPALISTNLSDDRVHPAHALKFYARLRRTPHARVWLYAPDEGGHTNNSTQEQIAAELACVFCFLNKHIV